LIGLNAVTTVAVPEQVAVPFERVAVVGAVAYFPVPGGVITNAVPPAITFVPVNAIDPIPLRLPLRNVALQVCPTVPVIVPPLV
jgi:hypothetical protein